MGKYKWDTPFGWLMEKVDEWDENELRGAFYNLAVRTENDTIQDIFQTEMSQDGYFDKLPE